MQCPARPRGKGGGATARDRVTDGRQMRKAACESNNSGRRAVNEAGEACGNAKPSVEPPERDQVRDGDGTDRFGLLPSCQVLPFQLLSCWTCRLICVTRELHRSTAAMLFPTSFSLSPILVVFAVKRCTKTDREPVSDDSSMFCRCQ